MTQQPPFAPPSPSTGEDSAPAYFPAPAQPADVAPYSVGAPAQRQRPSRRKAPVGVWIMAILLAFALGLVTGGIGAREYFGLGPRSLESPSVQPTLPPSVATAQSDVGKVAQTVIASTVYIESYSGSEGGSGTGVIYRADGVIVTNAHVITPTGEVAKEINVTIPSGERLTAEVLGYTHDYDIAVLQIDATGLSALSLADSDTIPVGDQVVAVGAPLGLTGTVTTGIISATNRPVRSGDAEIQSFINAVQTDAAINPGNSGGPLVNMSGQMIGLNSAIAQPVNAVQQSVGSIGLGFAIPSSQVKHSADEILDKGYATYPVMGIMVDMADRRTGAKVLEDSGSTKGVVAGGPAESAGLKAGDRILFVNGKRIGSVTEFIVYLRSLHSGQEVAIVAERDGEQIEATVTLHEQRAK